MVLLGSMTFGVWQELDIGKGGGQKILATFSNERSQKWGAKPHCLIFYNAGNIYKWPGFPYSPPPPPPIHCSARINHSVTVNYYVSWYWQPIIKVFVSLAGYLLTLSLYRSDGEVLYIFPIIEPYKVKQWLNEVTKLNLEYLFIPTPIRVLLPPHCKRLQS